MRKLLVSNNVTLDGYFTGKNGDLSWSKQLGSDPEWGKFVTENASRGGDLLFGRVTYEMMVGYWPTPQAAEQMPIVAEQMNRLQKFVFSRTLDQVSWNNTKLLKGDLATEIRALKESKGPDLVILGSGSIVAQLAPLGLIDEYQIVIFPVVLGEGRTMFEGVTTRPTLKLGRARVFDNGNVLMGYERGAGVEPVPDYEAASHRGM
jgi:dihydrofolate reductase